jgi:basic membrane lipoprotein Med (substrate-binding protein (PBP1-ABC) superfamily)
MKGTKRSGITALVGALIVIIVILVGVAAYAFAYPPTPAPVTTTTTFTASGSATTVTVSKGVASEIGALKVGLILPLTPADDSWNYNAHYQLLALQKEFNFTSSESDNQASGSTALPVAQTWAAAGYNVIILQGAQYQAMAQQIAPQYPKTLFVCVDCTVANYSNVYRIWLDLSGGGFVLGAMAGMLSTSDKFGLLGGGFVPSIWEGHEGFISGILYTYSGTPTFLNKFEAFAWADSAGAETDATADYTNGAQIVFSSGDGIDVGVLGAAMNQPTSTQVWATNVYTNLTAVEPADNRILLGSIIVNYAPLYFKAMLDYVTGNWAWGYTKADMASGVIRVQPGPNVPTKIAQAGLVLQNDIVEGAITLSFKTDSSGNPYCFDNPKNTSCADTSLVVPPGGGQPTGNTAALFNYLPPVSSLP